MVHRLRLPQWTKWVTRFILGAGFSNILVRFDGFAELIRRAACVRSKQHARVEARGAMAAKSNVGPTKSLGFGPSSRHPHHAAAERFEGPAAGRRCGHDHGLSGSKLLYAARILGAPAPIAVSMRNKLNLQRHCEATHFK
jgi:hypothetical protein